MGKHHAQGHEDQAPRRSLHTVTAQGLANRLTASSAGPAPQRTHKIDSFYLVTANLNTAESGGILLLNVITP